MARWNPARLAALPASLRTPGRELCERVRAAGGRALLVGGCTRDAALGHRVTDLDVEVFGIGPEQLEALLTGDLAASRVGRAFSIWKLNGTAIDVSIPRTPGGEFAPRTSPASAARRRDFTLNAIGYDPLEDDWIDPLGGLEDLDRRLLRHTSKRFADDPVRVLRGMQLVARFELEVAPETVSVCRTLSAVHVAPERVFGEWRKLVLLGKRPSLGLAFLRDCGWTREFPELEALIDCPQDPEWHPEGDVWVHTLHCMDAFAEERTGEEREDLVVGLAVLCHDLGKPETTRDEDGRITSKGHESLGEERTREFLGRLTTEAGLIDEIAPLVGAHLAPVQLHSADSGDAAVRRLARRVGRIDRLVRVARADQRGRPPLRVDEFPAGSWLLERARALEVEASAPQPIVLGRHLLELGLSPGPELGPLLESCFTAQIEGRFSDLEGGRAFARRLVGRREPPSEA